MLTTGLGGVTVLITVWSTHTHAHAIETDFNFEKNVCHSLLIKKNAIPGKLLRNVRNKSIPVRGKKQQHNIVFAKI